MKKSSRRKFLLSSATVGIGSMLATPALGKLFAAENTSAILTDTGFDQQPLAYPYNALEPSIDAMTMEIHYTKHAAAYSKNLKEAALAENVDTKKPLEDVLNKISKYSVKMRNNGGGHYNHELFWKSLTPKAGTQPSEKLRAAINLHFGSADKFKAQFSDAAKTRFGSGWAWLLVNSDKKLIISSTPNQDNPLMDIAEVKGTPLLGLDVWEHAYYLKYQNRRPEYIENFWKILNWDFVSERFSNI
jgi:superoxide dismutase, Fe-Mn family